MHYVTIDDRTGGQRRATAVTPARDRRPTPLPEWRRRLRRQAESCLRSDWFGPLSKRLARRYGGVSTSLMYHRVATMLPEPKLQRRAAFRPNLCLTVSAARFDEQMRELQASRRCLALPDAVAALRHGELERDSVTITFDDGYRDNLAVALPILERYGLPATIFITTGLVDRSALLWWEELERIVCGGDRLAFDWADRHWQYALDDCASRWAAYADVAALFRELEPDRQRLLMQRLREQSQVRYDYDAEILSWDEVRALDSHPLITIAAHTVNHPVLRNLDHDRAAREIGESRARLERELRHPVPFFAYPFGGPDEAGQREFGLCAEHGFTLALTTRAGHWQREHAGHPHALPRIMIDHHDTLDSFRFKLSGLDAFLCQRGRRVVTA